MTTLSKTLIAAAAFRRHRDLRLLEGAHGIQIGHGLCLRRPGKMSAMAMAPGEKNHEAMMKHATKVPNNTVFFMDNGQLYSVSGTLDPTGNFYRP